MTLLLRFILGDICLLVALSVPICVRKCVKWVFTFYVAFTHLSLFAFRRHSFYPGCDVCDKTFGKDFRPSEPESVCPGMGMTESVRFNKTGLKKYNAFERRNPRVS